MKKLFLLFLCCLASFCQAQNLPTVSCPLITGPSYAIDPTVITAQIDSSIAMIKRLRAEQSANMAHQKFLDSIQNVILPEKVIIEARKLGRDLEALGIRNHHGLYFVLVKDQFSTVRSIYKTEVDSNVRLYTLIESGSLLADTTYIFMGAGELTLLPNKAKSFRELGFNPVPVTDAVLSRLNPNRLLKRLKLVLDVLFFDPTPYNQSSAQGQLPYPNCFKWYDVRPEQVMVSDRAGQMICPWPEFAKKVLSRDWVKTYPYPEFYTVDTFDSDHWYRKNGGYALGLRLSSDTDHPKKEK